MNGGDCGKSVLCADLGRIAEKFVFTGCVDGGGVISALLELYIGSGGGVEGITMSGESEARCGSELVTAIVKKALNLPKPSALAPEMTTGFPVTPSFTLIE